MGNGSVRPAVVVEVPLTSEVRQRLMLLEITSRSPELVWDAVMSGDALDPRHLHRALDMRAN